MRRWQLDCVTLDGKKTRIVVEAIDTKAAIALADARQLKVWKAAEILEAPPPPVIPRTVPMSRRSADQGLVIMLYGVGMCLVMTAVAAVAFFSGKAEFGKILFVFASAFFGFLLVVVGAIYHAVGRLGIDLATLLCGDGERPPSAADERSSQTSDLSP